MCTLAIFFKAFEGYPLLVAANRDERYDRPSLPPSLIDAEPKIVAGRDLSAGGTWLGVNEYGLLVGILNRRLNREGAADFKGRSRGLLALDLLRLPSAREAAGFLECHGETYNPFTLLFADQERAGVAFNHEDSILLRSLHAGLHVFSSAAEIDTASDKADRAYARFQACAGELVPDGNSRRWIARFKVLLGDHTAVSAEQPRDAVCVHGADSGTVSASVIYYAAMPRRFETFYCSGPPCQNSFGAPLPLDAR
jgi:uncharacterized protein with NRDE domain